MSVVLSFLLTSTAPAADVVRAGPATRDAGRTVAVLSADPGTPVAEPFPSLLANVLQESVGVRLVEREQIHLALEELRRSAGLSETAQALKLGKILAADAIVRLSPITGQDGKPLPSARFRTIDSRTGLILDSGVIETVEVTQNTDPLVARFKSAFGRVPLSAGTRFIGVLDVRGEEIGTGLDAAAEQLRSLLCEELSRTPGVFLLERDNISQLVQERNLADLPETLRTSTYLLELGIRTAPAGRLQATLRFRPLTGGAATETRFDGPAANLPALRGSAVDSVIRHLSLTARAAPAQDPVREADAFVVQARVLVTQKQFDPAIRAAEVAVALDPTPARRLAAYQVAQSCLDVPRVVFQSSDGKRTILNLPIDMPEMIRISIRAGYLQLAALDDLGVVIDKDTLAAKEAARASMLPNQALDEFDHRFKEYRTTEWYYSILANWKKPDEPALRAACDKLHDVGDRRYQKICQLRLRYGVTLAPAISDHLTGVRSTRTPAEADALVADCIRTYFDDAKRSPPTGRQAILFYHHLSAAFHRYDFGPIAGRGADPSPYRAHADLRLRLIARANSFPPPSKLSVSDADLAEQVLSDLWSGLPIDGEQAAYAEQFENDLLSPHVQACAVLEKVRPGSVDKLLNQFVESCSAERSSRRLIAHRAMIQTLVAASPRQESVAKVLALLKQFTPDASMAKYARALETDLSKIRVKSEGAIAAATQPSTRPATASKLAVTKIPLTQTERMNGSVLATVPVGDDIVALCGGRTGQGPLETWQISPKQATATKLSRKPLAVTGFVRVTGVVSIEKIVYVASDYGLIVIDGENLELRSAAQGLPAAGIQSIAALDGRLLLGFDGGIAWYDPAKGTVQTVASNKRLANEGPLDGGESYKVSALLTDKPRHCVWIGIASATRTPADRAGVWKLDLKTSTLARLTIADKYRGGPLTLSETKVGYFTAQAAMFPPNGVVWIDPEKQLQAEAPYRPMFFAERSRTFSIWGPDLVVTDTGIYSKTSTLVSASSPVFHGEALYKVNTDGSGKMTLDRVEREPPG